MPTGYRKAQKSEKQILPLRSPTIPADRDGKKKLGYFGPGFSGILNQDDSFVG